MARETAAQKKARLAAEAEANAITLAKIADATQTTGFLYTPATIHAPLIAEGLAEVNPEMTREDGWIATRATEKGMQKVNETNSNAAAPADTASNVAPVAPAATPAAKPVFQIAKGIAVPAIQRGGGRVTGHTIYPFDSMDVNDSFFVPNSEDKPNAAKSLASTVSSANARYSEEVKDENGNVKTRVNRKGATVPETRQIREFAIRARTAEQEKAAGFDHGQAGARIWRVL
jgi:hypothetical protein